MSNRQFFIERWEAEHPATVRVFRTLPAWLALLDAVHHRGQLSVYLRPMGGKIPSIYVPSADDLGM